MNPLLSCPLLIAGLGDGFVLRTLPVEAVMLNQEQDIEEHRKNPEAKLRRVSENQLPLIWRRTRTQSDTR